MVIDQKGPPAPKYLPFVFSTFYFHSQYDKLLNWLDYYTDYNLESNRDDTNPGEQGCKENSNINGNSSKMQTFSSLF